MTLLKSAHFMASHVLKVIDELKLDLPGRAEIPMRAAKLLAFLFCLTLLISLPAVADTCNAFAGYTCAKSTPNVVNFVGGSTGQSVNVLLSSNTFDLTIHGNASFAGDDLIILAAAPNGLTGSIGIT